jgi:hypothetical protein
MCGALTLIAHIKARSKHSFLLSINRNDLLHTMSRKKGTILIPGGFGEIIFIRARRMG